MRAAAGRAPSRRAAGKLSGGRDEHGWPQARMVIMTALQRQPAYRVAVVNRRHAGLFAVAGDRIDTVAQPAAAGVRSPRYGGWYGLESHRVNERIAELAHRHFRDIVGILAQAIRPGQERLVGGHADAIPQFLAILPPDLRDRFIGSLVADTSTVTPARVRALAVPIIRNWVERSEPQLVTQIRLEPPGGLSPPGRGMPDRDPPARGPYHGLPGPGPGVRMPVVRHSRCHRNRLCPPRTTRPPAPADGAGPRQGRWPACRPVARRGRKHAASGIAGGTAGHVGCGCVAGARAVWRMVSVIGAEGREPGRGAA
jgi:hypothetical protein